MRNKPIYTKLASVFKAATELIRFVMPGSSTRRQYALNTGKIQETLSETLRLIRDEKHDEAIRQLKVLSELSEILPNDPYRMHVLERMALAYYQREDYSKTKEYCDQILEREPDNETALFMYLDFASDDMNNFDEAHAKISSFFERNPENTSFLERTIEIYTNFSRHDLALEYMERLKAKLLKDLESKEQAQALQNLDRDILATRTVVDYFREKLPDNTGLSPPTAE